MLQNIDKAMEQTGVTKTDGAGRASGSNSGKVKGFVLGKFWGAHQRFFNQIITASQMPSIIEQIETDLKNSLAVVLQLTNTDEAGQNRALGVAAANRMLKFPLMPSATGH